MTISVMKNAFIILIIASLLPSCASTIHFADDEYYTGTYDDAAGTQDQLFLKANSWLVETFNSANSVVQHSDKQAGAIIGKCLLFGGINTGFGTSYDYRVFAIIEIRVKDNKARIEIKPQSSWNYNEATVDRYSKEQAKADCENLAESFHQAMVKEVQDF